MFFRALGLFAILFAVVWIVPTGARATTFTASPRMAPSVCSGLVINGGFESGTTGWQIRTNGPFALIGSALPHTGQLGAILGACNDAQDELEQEMNLPAGQGVTLRFWWYMLTQEIAHPRDTLDVLVKPSGGQEASILHITYGIMPGAWQQAVLDLSSYAGQSLQIKFRATTDANRPTVFHVDDVSVHGRGGNIHVDYDAYATTVVSPTRTSTPKARIYLLLPLR
jgi:thermitase